MEWLAGNQWLLIAAICIGLIALVRLIRNEHLAGIPKLRLSRPSTGERRRHNDSLYSQLLEHGSRAVLRRWDWGLWPSLAFLGPLGPILTGIANAIGAPITAIFEIVASLARSAEGRVSSCILRPGLGFSLPALSLYRGGESHGTSAHIEKIVHSLALQARRQT